jgi:hypothetical protein
MFLGGLFGAGSTAGPSSSGSSSSTTSTQIDPGGNYTPLMESVLGVGQGLLNKQYEGYDPSKRFEGFSADQTAAQQGVRDAQGNWQPNFNQAQTALNAGQAGAAGVGAAGQTAFGTAAAGPGGLGAANPYLNKASGSWTDPGTASAWMNPYTKNVTDATAQQANEAFRGPGGALEGLTGAFTGGGAAQFGRERMGDVAGKLSADFGRGLTQSLATVNQQGYNQGQTAFGNEQQRMGQLGQTAGGLGVQDVQAQTNLGTAQTNAAATGARSNIEAGQAQSKMGQDTSAAAYKDASMLGTSGATQQAFGQQAKDFDYQQNREAYNWDFQRAQQAQSLAQGWQLPTTTNSTTSTQQQTTQPSGSVAGNILGAATAIGGLSTGKDTTVAGDVGTWLGKQTAAEGGHIHAATGGHLAFGPGGQVPVTRAVRARAQRRQPAIMARLQAMGGPGITPGQTPGMMPPPTAFASGGRVYPVQSRTKDYELYHPSMWQEDWSGLGWARGGQVDDDAHDREMIRNAVWAHERAMHDANDRQLTALKRFAFGGPVGYAEGGSSNFIPVGGGTRVAPTAFDDMRDPRVDPAPTSMMVLPMDILGGAATGAAGTGQGGVGGAGADAASEGSAAAGTSGDAGSDGGGTYAFGGRARYDEGGPSDTSDWFAQRDAMRRANLRQRLMESTLRNSEHESEARADPAGYWADTSKQFARGLLSPTTLLGVPGSALNMWRDFADLEGKSSLPTYSGMNRFLDNTFGDPRTAGGRGGSEAGRTLANAFGVGAGNRVASGIGGLSRLGRTLAGAAPFGDAWNLGNVLQSAFGD